MKTYIVVAFLALAGFVYADDGAANSGGKDDKVAAKDANKDNGKKDGNDDKLPSPSELIKKLKATQQKEDQKTKVAYFDFTRPVQEAPAGFSVFGDDGAMTLRSLIDR